MVRFRPHMAKVTMAGGDSVYNQETGEWTTQEPQEIKFPCRVSPNGSGKKVANQDGNMVEYGFMVHADKAISGITYGAKIEVYDGEELKAKGEVIGCFTNQLNTRIWI